MESETRSRAEATGSFCPLCVDFEGGSMAVHKETKRHKYNYMLKKFSDNKKSMVKDRNGIEICITCPPFQIEQSNASGTVMTSLDTEADGTKYLFSVKNISKNPILLIKVSLLHPYPVFKLQYDDSLIAAPFFKGESRLVTVTFESSGIGYYVVPVCLLFHKSGYEFMIVKTIAIKVTKETVIDPDPDEDSTEVSPFKGITWGLMNGIVPSMSKYRGPTDEPLGYTIPKEYKRIFKHALKVWDDIPDLDLQNLTAMLMSYPQQVGYADGFKETHNDFFHVMLWLDEYRATLGLQKYNMACVPMRLVMDNQVELKVPGLAEKRPSVIKGDILTVRVSFQDGLFELDAYEGQISHVFESCVWIRDFHPHLLQRMHYAESQRHTMLFDVRFTLTRWPMYVKHMALDYVNHDGNLDVVFPEEKGTMTLLVADNNYKFFNKDIKMNAEQTVAVHNIVNGSSRPSPYVVFGPPGTGKTVTIVEAILQIKKLFAYSYVLVCAPSNSACDHIVQLLMKNCSGKDLLRLNSRTRDRNLVPKDILSYCNKPEVKLNSDDLKKYRIIVCTLIMATRFSSSEEHHFTHVFIDEAGQPMEPEALVAVGGILGPVSPLHPGGQLVLAGDPKQLGPICCSRTAQDAGLGVSLLERLMDNCTLYQRGKDGNFNARFFTKLLDNYRSHPSLLELPNQLFYDGELKPKCGPQVLDDPLCSAVVLGSKGPLVFQGVIGQERREGKSPSFFNQLEIDAVMQHMKALLDPSFRPEVLQSEIGVIAPYMRQVYKLKLAFMSHGWDDVEVGTTETFQGREKRVILISTVRANRNLLDYDRHYKLGFLTDKKRFNVAVTRARCLLIVIGCPHVLEMDNSWRLFINNATEHGSYQGCIPYSLKDERWVDNIMERVAGPFPTDADAATVSKRAPEKK